VIYSSNYSEKANRVLIRLLSK